MEAHQAAYEPSASERTTGDRIEALARRTLDMAVAALLLVLLAPLLLAVALATRLESPGPALFRQRRLGQARHAFTVYKFRTMRAAADAAQHRQYVQELISRGGDAAVHGSRQLFKLAVDDRVTRVGRVLRRWSLDELPQLWNVLRGDMSLVGPRPVIPYEVELYPPWYMERFAVKPGLTGLWQVSGRSERTYEEMVRYDIEYARRRSLWLDLVILAKTAFVVVRGKGAA
jgi:lipopolysaccharide/colanic/teichoic acid biosynthesis glycosyltransferase